MNTCVYERASWVENASEPPGRLIGHHMVSTNDGEEMLSSADSGFFSRIRTGHRGFVIQSLCER